MTDSRTSVAFICTGNTCRSQMAEAYLRHIAGDRFDVYSAGSDPGEKIAELAIEVMSEIGIDITSQIPKPIGSILHIPIDNVITVCENANKNCPVFQSGSGDVVRIHWPVDDPWGGSIDEYRRARDELVRRITLWLESEFGIWGV